MTEPHLGYWNPGDPPGHRQFLTFENGEDHGLTVESGGRLENLTIAYETWGMLNASRTNAVLIEHALTGDSHVTGGIEPGHPTKGWWDGVVGAGLAVDTDVHFVVCANVLGGAQGTTGPSSRDPSGVALGSRFPVITIRDQVAVEVALADFLGIESWFAVVGGSMGGMRALEWAVGFPDRVSRLVVLAVGAASTADEIALSSLQVRAIRADANYQGGDYYDTGRTPREGLSLARGLGQFTYRTGGEFGSRFGREMQRGEDALRGGRYAIESYLEYHGHKLTQRFDANSYVVLSEAMNHHDVGRDRGGIAHALGTISATTTVIGIDSDRLYPLYVQEELVDLIPHARPLEVITSRVGHDGFLLEVEQIGALLRSALKD
jgi:homoserine O-acetyltransferase